MCSLLIKRLSDGNSRVRGSAAAALVFSSQQSVVGIELLCDVLLDGAGDLGVSKVRDTNSRLALGKLYVLNALIESTGLDEAVFTVSRLTPMLTESLLHSDASVRATALEVLASVYRYAGDQALECVQSAVEQRAALKPLINQRLDAVDNESEPERWPAYDELLEEFSVADDWLKLAETASANDKLGTVIEEAGDTRESVQDTE